MEDSSVKEWQEILQQICDKKRTLDEIAPRLSELATLLSRLSELLRDQGIKAVTKQHPSFGRLITLTLQVQQLLSSPVCTPLISCLVEILSSPADPRDSTEQRARSWALSNIMSAFASSHPPSSDADIALVMSLGYSQIDLSRQIAEEAALDLTNLLQGIEIGRLLPSEQELLVEQTPHPAVPWAYLVEHLCLLAEQERYAGLIDALLSAACRESPFPPPVLQLLEKRAPQILARVSAATRHKLWNALPPLFHSELESTVETLASRRFMNTRKRRTTIANLVESFVVFPALYARACDWLKHRLRETGEYALVEIASLLHESLFSALQFRDRSLLQYHPASLHSLVSLLKQPVLPPAAFLVVRAERDRVITAYPDATFDVWFLLCQFLSVLYRAMEFLTHPHFSNVPFDAVMDYAVWFLEPQSEKERERLRQDLSCFCAALRDLVSKETGILSTQLCETASQISAKNYSLFSLLLLRTLCCHAPALLCNAQVWDAVASLPVPFPALLSSLEIAFPRLKEAAPPTLSAFLSRWGSFVQQVMGENRSATDRADALELLEDTEEYFHPHVSSFLHSIIDRIRAGDMK